MSTEPGARARPRTTASLWCLPFFLLLTAFGGGPNRVLVDLPSPDGRHHVEVRECPQGGAFGWSKETQAAVLEAGRAGTCLSSANTLARFTVYAPESQLELEWISNARLRAWHPAFAPSGGPRSASRMPNSPVEVVFAPK